VAAKTPKFYSRITRLLTRLVFWLFLSTLLAVLILRFVPPVTSAFMVERYCRGRIDSKARKPIQYQWTNYKKISPNMALAAVAAEDQKFPDHFGFDFESMVDALEGLEEGERIRGASTISQQVAKNLFLWKGRSYVRKGFEAYFTVLLEVMWPKRRILEVYLNLAEFGDGIYGVEAAAQRYFRKPASRLTPYEASLLAAVLPNPIRLKVAAPSPYVYSRAIRIQQQMRNLGPAYLKQVW